MGGRELPKGWEWRRLGEIAEINSRFDKNSFDDETDVTFLPMRCVEELTGRMDTSTERKYGEIKTGYTPIQEGDLLFAKITPCMENGKIAIAQNLKNGIGFASTEFHTLKFSLDNETKFYFFYLMQEKIRQEAARNMTGTAGQHRVPVTFLKKMKVPVPPLPVQRQIVAVLEHAEAVKRQRREADALTGALLQSVFYEMFGDPVTNVRGWTVKRIKDVAMIEKNVVNPDESNESYQTYVGLENIEKETGKLTQSSEIDSNEIKSAKFRFSNEHILYGKLRPYLNKVALPDFDGICSTDILTIKPLLNESTREFLCYLLRQKYFVDFANERSIGANLPRVSPNTILDFKAPIPPLALQWQFARVVQEVERLREKQVASGRHIEGLCEGLMQRAFAGELVA